MQIAGSPLRSDWQYPWTPRRQWDAEEEWPFSGSRLLRLNPTSLDARVLAAMPESYHTPPISKLDDLIQRHPQHPWIAALRLRRSISVKIARLARRRYPDNAFFDWMLIRALLDGNRGPEALQHLKTAVGKPHYDPYTREIIRSSIAAHQLVRPLLLEEKAQLASTVMNGFVPDHGHSVRLALRLAANAKKRGEHSRALQMYGDLALLLHKLRIKDDHLGPYRPWDYAGRNVSDPLRGLQALIWTKAAEGTPYSKLALPKKASRDQRLRARARRFGDYVRKHGRHDLAVAATQQVEALLGDKFYSRPYQRYAWLPNHVIPTSLQDRIFEYWYLALGCVICLVLLTGLRLSLAAPLWTPRLRSEPLRRSDIRLTNLFYGIFATAMLGLVFWTGDVEDKDVVVGIVIMLICYLPVMLLFSALLCTVVICYRHRDKIYGPRPPEPGFHAGHVPRSLIPPFLAAISWTVFGLAALSWLGLYALTFVPGHMITAPVPPIFQEPGAPTTTTIDWVWFFICGLFFTIVGYFGWLIRWRWLAPHDLKPIAHYTVRWHLRSLGDLAVVLSFAYLISSVAGLPTRRAAEAKFEAALAAPTAEIRRSVTTSG